MVTLLLYQAPKLLLVLTVGAVYSAVTPLILPFAALYFGIAMLVLKYKLVYVHEANQHGYPCPYPLGAGSLWPRLVSRVVVALGGNAFFWGEYSPFPSLHPSLVTPPPIPLPPLPHHHHHPPHCNPLSISNVRMNNLPPRSPSPTRQSCSS